MASKKEYLKKSMQPQFVDSVEDRIRIGLKHDPLRELVRMLDEEDLSISERIKIEFELLNYMHPKKRSIAVNPDEGKAMNFTIAFASKDKAQEFASDIKSNIDEVIEYVPPVPELNEDDEER